MAYKLLFKLIKGEKETSLTVNRDKSRFTNEGKREKMEVEGANKCQKQREGK